MNFSTQPAFLDIQEKEAVFPQSDPLLLVLNTAKGISGVSPEKQFTELLSQIAQLTNWNVVGAHNTEAGKGPLWCPNCPPIESPYNSFFWSPDRVLWKIYLQPVDSRTPEWAELDIFAKRTDVAFMGESWLDRWVLSAMFKDLQILVPLTLGILFLVLLFMTKTLRAAPWLTLVAIMPALSSLIPFGLWGSPITFGTLVAPFLVLALSTTYSLHIWHHHEHHGFDFVSLWKHRGRPMLWAGGTTFLGFFTLIISPVDELRMLGYASLLGLTAVFIWTLGALPILLGWFLPSVSTTADDLHHHLQKISPFRKYIPGILVVIFVPSLFWLPQLRMGLEWKDLFWPQDPAVQALDWLEDHGDVVEPWVLLGEGPQDEYWWQPEALFTMDSWRRENAHRIKGVLDYTEILDTLWKTWEPGALTDQGESLTPMVLAELSELIPRSAGLPQVMDSQGKSTLIYIFGDPGKSTSNQEYLDNVTHSLGKRLPGVKWTWIGPRYRRTMGEQAYAQGQVWGLGLYFAIIGGVVLFGVARHRRLLWVPLVPLSAIMLILGLSAALGWRITPALSLVLAEVAGVSVDEAFLWAFMGSLGSVRRTVVQSSLLLCLLLIPLTFSSFFSLFQVAILTMTAFAFSTSVVLFVLPWKYHESS